MSLTSPESHVSKPAKAADQSLDQVGLNLLDDTYDAARELLGGSPRQLLKGEEQSLAAATNPLPPFSIGEAQAFAGMTALNANRLAIDQFFTGSQTESVRRNVDSKIAEAAQGGSVTWQHNSRLRTQA